jgi:two-component system alkaline phosphatase synthesis response regulator PhoP
MQHEMRFQTVASAPGLSHILVVDDDPFIVQVLQEDLKDIGYTVHCAYDGQAALQSVQQYRPNLIILDVSMPIVNGLEVLEDLRAQPDTRNIPVILVSGEPPKDIFPAIAGQSRIAYLTKPFDFESLNALVQLNLDQYPTA